MLQEKIARRSFDTALLVIKGQGKEKTNLSVLFEIWCCLKKVIKSAFTSKMEEMHMSKFLLIKGIGFLVFLSPILVEAIWNIKLSYYTAFLFVIIGMSLLNIGDYAGEKKVRSKKLIALETITLVSVFTLGIIFPNIWIRISLIIFAVILLEVITRLQKRTEQTEITD